METELLTQSVEIVRRAEQEVRQLLMRAANEGEYTIAAKLVNWAKQLRQLLDVGHAVDGTRGIADGQSPLHLDPDISPRVSASRRKPAKRKGRRLNRSRTAKATTAEYPKFFRNGEELVKLGWSKKQKTVYQHKAPKRVVLLVAQAVQRISKESERFVAEQVFPLHDPEHNADVPSYQAYLSLAWLRKEHVIVQHGRQGYSLATNSSAEPSVETRWANLPVRK